ncbi:hypothetical protein Poly21_48680 [Allorhodopirellula heiligendammensis]|uniref:Uncharacterized protein n=1 Tax=Allorhodopirellula heiligendammensis TaxID=2714739 RepID=A0A5C6BGW3_9BACT|nr:hypothetical protein Poly21_48680 [Allorhodopirellula heiligendammensis]
MSPMWLASARKIDSAGGNHLLAETRLIGLLDRSRATQNNPCILPERTCRPDRYQLPVK